MNEIEISSLFNSNINSINFSLTNTPRDANIDINSISSSGVIIDQYGTLYSNGTNSSDLNITFIGGINTFAYEKEPRNSYLYLTENQINTLYKILKTLAIYTDMATINASNEDLQHLCQGMYFNSNG